MSLFVTSHTEGDQIEFHIMSQPAARTYVVYFQRACSPAPLAAPTVTFKNKLSELAIGVSIKFEPWLLGRDHSHPALLAFSRSLSLWFVGRRFVSRVTALSKSSESLFSKLAPAKKSAQIISRQ